MVVQNGVEKTRHAGLTVNIPEYRAPEVGPQHASPSAVASPMFGARENSRQSPSPERKTSTVNFNRENLLNEPGDAGRAPMLGPQHASPSAVASPMFGAREKPELSPSPERVTSTVVDFNRENLLNEPGDAGQESPLFSLGIARARCSSHGGTINTMGSRPSSDSSGTHAEGGSDTYRTPSRTSSANSTASYLHRIASRNVAHSMHMLESRHGSSAGSINNYTATWSEYAPSDASG